MLTKLALAPPYASEYLTAEEVATLYRWRVSTVYQYASQRILPSIKIGKSLRFRRQDLDRLIEERPVQGGGRRDAI